MAGDSHFAPMLLALGLMEFSLHPATLLELRRTIRHCDLAQLQSRAPALLRARDRAGIEEWIAENAPVVACCRIGDAREGVGIPGVRGDNVAMNT